MDPREAARPASPVVLVFNHDAGSEDQSTRFQQIRATRGWR